MTDAWLQAVNDGNVVGYALVDFRKAFNLVDHNYKINKLSLLNRI